MNHLILVLFMFVVGSTVFAGDAADCIKLGSEHRVRYIVPGMLTVAHRFDRAIPGSVRIRLFVNENDVEFLVFDTKTDAASLARGLEMIFLPPWLDRPHDLRLLVHADGYSSKNMTAQDFSSSTRFVSGVFRVSMSTPFREDPQECVFGIPLVRGSRTVTGRITDCDGKPLVGAEVHLRVCGKAGTMTCSHVVTATTGEHGVYRLDDLPETIETVEICYPGKATVFRRVSIPIKVPHLRMFDFTLPDARPMRLRFVDEESRPVPGVAISTWKREHPDVVMSYQSDAQGRWIWAEASEEPEKLRIVTRKKTVGRGFMRRYEFSYLSELGEAEIGASDDDPFESSDREKDKTPEATLRHYGTENIIWLRADGEERTVVLKRLELSPGDERLPSGLDWDLPETMSLRFQDVQGRPLPGVRAKIRLCETRYRGEERLFEATATSDSRGLLSFDFSNFDSATITGATLRLSLAGYVMREYSWYTANNGSRVGREIPEEQTVTLVRPRSIQGWVVDLDRSPSAGATVYLEFRQPQWGGAGEPDRKWSSDHWHQVISDQDGRWRFDILPENAKDVRILVYDSGVKNERKCGVVTEEELRLQQGVIYLELESERQYRTDGANW